MLKKQYILYLLLPFVIISQGYSTDDPSPSKSSSIKKSKVSANTKELIQQADELEKKSPTTSVELLEQALSQSIANKDKKAEAQCYESLAELYYNRSLYELAIQNATNCNAITPKASQYLIIAESQKKLHLYNESLKSFESYENMNGSDKVKAFRGKGECFYFLGNYNAAKRNLETALNLVNIKNNPEEYTLINQRLGEVNEKLNQKGKALEYYQDANAAANTYKWEDKEENLQSVSRANASQLLEETASPTEQIEFHNENIKLDLSNKNYSNAAFEQIAIANVYLKEKDTKKAIPELIKSINYSLKGNDIKTRSEAYKKLSEAYKLEKNYDQSIKAYEKYATLKDSLLAIQEKKLNEKYKTDYQLTEKQKKIDLLEKDILLHNANEKAQISALKNLQIIVISLIIGLIFIIISAYILYRNIQKRRIANQLLALKSLRSQMNPHFIFNALNSVNSFISQSDERSANKYLSEFARLMRLVMENSQHNFVPLHDEITLLKLYLNLEHIRFKEKFDYEFIVDENIDIDKIMIPPMLIQPCIENAIWHGLRYKSEKGFLKVEFSTKNNHLQINITDNGIGREKSKNLKTTHQKFAKSTGIKNTESRADLIKELFDKQIEITIKDAFVNQEDCGTNVQITIPFQS